ncbi:MAG: hypothetical protein JW984_06040 [Deltaproteobacteria bacterium]|uniref:Uncharacterized protein n=1 Tax=Candidatus Zymogenus saltonus TaxID=2844893 RepID=A0A9D8KER2_9DELT|nr:hypothetical protein [Candidatus Zymogenus saltonus]
MKCTRIDTVKGIKEKLKRLTDGINKLDPDSRYRLKRLFAAIVSAIVLFNFIITIFLVMEVTSLRKKTAEALKNADDVMEALALKQILSEPGWIDPTSKDVQYIGFGLFVNNIKTVASDGGLLVSGIIVNGTSVDHYDARFTLLVEKGMEANFKIDSIRSGSGAPFAVTIKRGEETENPAAPKMARLIYRGSIINSTRD